MSIIPARRGLLAVLLIAISAGPAFAQATVPQVLTIKPKSDDVSYSTPEGKDIASCKLENVAGNRGYLLSDANGQPLRRFVDSDGDGKVDTWSFYKDGTEVYRESYQKDGYHFRWLGQGGMKWGTGTVGPAGKAIVSTWRWISADEAANEAFAALTTGDFDRLKVLFVTPQEMQAVGLSAAEVAKLTALQQNAQAKFQQVRGKMPTIAKAKFSRLEGALPGAYPAEAGGNTQDVVKARGLILFENDDAQAKKHDFLQTGDLIQVGNAWRLTDVPATDITPVNDPKLDAVLVKIAGMRAPGAKDQIGAWTMERVQLLLQAAELSQPKDRENWYKQIFDQLAAGVVANDKNCEATLAKWKNHFATQAPGSNMAAYATYRELWSLFQVATAPPATAKEVTKAQAKYHDDLVKFVTDFPKADDTPDALIQLAMGCEFEGGEKKEDEAKKWYAQILKDFANTPNGPKAAGAMRRLDSVNKNFELSGPVLNAGTTYSVTAAKQKVAVVYYWASYSTQAVGDFATLKKLQATFGKDLEIIAVNLDEAAAQANTFLQTSPLAATHLHDGGGMNGPLATQYGIFGLPHLFLIDRDGKVVSNKIQVSSLEDEISKLTKK